MRKWGQPRPVWFRGWEVTWCPLVNATVARIYQQLLRCQLYKNMVSLTSVGHELMLGRQVITACWQFTWRLEAADLRSGPRAVSLFAAACECAEAPALRTKAGKCSQKLYLRLPPRKRRERGMQDMWRDRSWNFSHLIEGLELIRSASCPKLKQTYHM